MKTAGEMKLSSTKLIFLLHLALIYSQSAKSIEQPQFKDPSNIRQLDYNEEEQPVWSSSETEIEEVFVLEEKDYPKSLFESYQGVGQVSGITTLPWNDVAIFHRANRQWTSDTFDSSDRVRSSNPKDELIDSDTIMILSAQGGSATMSFGSDLFYMPHGIGSDSKGNLWITDVGRHQVMRLPTRELFQQDMTRGYNHSIKPDIILGEEFVPGNDTTHFCKPADVKVSSSDDLIYVADGYCNSRIAVFNKIGQYVGSIGEGRLGPGVVHSLALVERRNMICVAERENSRILCFKAGLDGNLNSMGSLITEHYYPFGQVFAIESLGLNDLIVSSSQLDTNRYDLATLNLISRQVTPVWISSDLLEPHSLTKTRDGNYVYAADISRDAYKKVFQFKVIKGRL